MTLIYDLIDEELHVGEKIVLHIPIVDRDTGLPVNMTGMNLECTLSAVDGGPPLITKITGDGIALADSADTDDEAVVTLDAADTEVLKEGTYHYVLQRTDVRAVMKKGKLPLAKAVWS